MQALYDSWTTTIKEVRATIVDVDGYNYQMSVSSETHTCTTRVPVRRASATCAAPANLPRGRLHQPCDMSSQSARTPPPTTPDEMKGINPHNHWLGNVSSRTRPRQFGWLGHGWIGFASGSTPPNETQYMRPAALDVNYGEPQGLCVETATSSGVFARKRSKAAVMVDCNTMMEGGIQMETALS